MDKIYKTEAWQTDVEPALNMPWADLRQRPDSKAHLSDGAPKWISKGQNNTQSNRGGWHSNAVQTLGERSI